MENKHTFIGIIPARYGSSRFPGKPLATIGGVTMIERVWRQVKKVLDEAVVATDDARIYDSVIDFGGNAVMTSTEHRSGTDRCFEAYNNVDSQADVIINIQGDEPFIHPDQIREIMSCFDDETTQIATLARQFDENGEFDALNDWTKPKVVVDNRLNAMYFSRSVIPYVRSVNTIQWPKQYPFLMHVGMYAYKASVLAEITKLEQSSLEKAESLEQLRWLQNGYKIKVGLTTHSTIGIDTPQDLERANKYLSQDLL